MHTHLHMQMNMSTDYKPELKEIGLCLNYNTIKAHPEKRKSYTHLLIMQVTCARSFD